jgi:hypothetical protein
VKEADEIVIAVCRDTVSLRPFMLVGDFMVSVYKYK